MMHEVGSGEVPARLSRADSVSIGLGVLVWFVSYVWTPVQVMCAVAIFLPPVLRDVGLLKDASHRLRQAAHRAGFHALLFLVMMFLISHALVRQGVLTESAQSATAILNESYLRGLIVGVYLTSYLLQVLGSRAGTVAILLGAAVLAMAPLLAFYWAAGHPLTGAILMVAIPAILVLLAILVRQRPRFGGRFLLVLFSIGTSLVLLLGRERIPVEVRLSAILQMGLLLGCTGLALLRAERAVRQGSSKRLEV